MALGDKDYNVEFDDSLLSLKGWTNPRWAGSSLRSLYYNEYNPEGDHVKLIGTFQNGDLETTQKLRLNETRFATGVSTSSYGWWKDEYRFLDGNGGVMFGDPTIGTIGQPGHAFADTANTNGQGPRDISANVTYSGIRYLGPEEEFDLAPTLAYEGDDAYSVMPTIQNTTNTIFVGTKVLGNKEDKLYPGPGPDFSYLIINKAITFDTDDDSFFIIENETDDDPTFEKLVQTNLPWASKFRLKLLDDSQPHNLKKQYGVHFNRGLFGLFAKWTAYFDADTDTLDSNERYKRSLKSKKEAKHDFTILSSFVYLVESASNRYQIGFPGTPPSAGPGVSGIHPTYYGFNVTGSVNLISGSEETQLGGAAPAEHIFNPLLRITRTKFEWISRRHATPQDGAWSSGSIYGVVEDVKDNYGSTHKGGEFSGSLIINRNNPATQWWFQEGGVEEIVAINPIISESANYKVQSFRRLIERIYDQDKLYICTVNDAVNCDHTFRVGVEEVWQSNISSSEANYNTHANNFGSPLAISGATDKGVNGTQLFKVSKPLVTFGSFPWKGDTVGVPGCSPNRLHWADMFQDPSDRYEPQINIPDGYAPQFLNYAQTSVRYADTGLDASYHAGAAWEKSWWGQEFTYVANEFTATTQKIGNAAANNIIGDGTFTGFFNLSTKLQNVLFRTASDKGYPDVPFCDNWTISCLEERNNIILTNVNKQIDLAGGIGKKGFAIISDNLNPEIRQNLDFYLKKAGLIDSGPNLKDKNLVKYKPKPGFFKRIKKRNKPKY